VKELLQKTFNIFQFFSDFKASGSGFRVLTLMRIHADPDPDPKHCPSLLFCVAGIWPAEIAWWATI